jgi:exodeoxyribonuclease V gamma subunit
MLQLHRGSRGDRLAEGLATMLVQPAGDPFVAEIVSVPTRGVERWLSQQLAAVLGARPGRADGVCANVDFPFPGSVVGAALASATGIDHDRDPWAPERSVWPLLAVVDEALGEAWLDQLSAHLGAAPAWPDPDGDGERRARRFAAVRHLADLFDRYSVHRPDLLVTWGEGAEPERPDLAWQAELWRRLRERIGEPSPAERLRVACEVLRADPAAVDLPERLSLFGLTRLPPSYLQVLAALAEARTVHLWLLHPSPALWSKVSAAGLGTGPRRADRSAAVASHPLLRTWGRDAREMQLVLNAAGAAGEEALPDPDPAPTLLGRLQADVRADRAPGTGEPLLLDPSDRSLEVHACHGRARQVQVLRDAILHALDADPTLEPRDVIVMCPDIEEFAPLVHATFGAPAALRAGAAGGEAGADHAVRWADGLPVLPVRLADRSLRQTNPVLAAVARLLDLPSARLTASELLDLAGTPPVRARFGLDDDDLSRIDGWVRAAGIRWGLDPESRRPFGLHVVPDGTWRRGLDRILVGVTAAEDPPGLVEGVLPLDDVDSGDIDLAGRLAELVERTGEALAGLSGPQPVAGWLAAIGRAADLLLAVGPGEDWQRDQLRQLLADVDAELGTTGGGPVLSLPELRSLLADRLRGVPTRANFRTGQVTVCTLVPMRSVPHRIICLLGLDDGAFPRRGAVDADDVVGRDPQVGDRDARSEDRQLLLDALLAARERLIITYSGRDERTNAERAPAVPVGELLEVIDQTARHPSGRRASHAVNVHHPLQPWDDRCFEPGGVLGDGPWSFDPAALAGAHARRRPPVAPGAGFGLLLPPAVPDPVALDDLVAFVQHPVRAYLRQRLRITVRPDWEEPADALTVELDPLAGWAVGDRLLGARLAGLDPWSCMRAELARGFLPPGAMGERAVQRIMRQVDGLVTAAGEPSGDPTSLDVTVPVGPSWSVAGTIGDVHGDQLRSVSYSRLGPKHRLAAWVRLLALSAAEPDRPWQAVTVGRAAKGDGVAVARAGPLGADPGERAAAAGLFLHVIVDLFGRGMRHPLPLAAKTSLAWADAARRGRDPVRLARTEWETGYDDRFDKEDRDRAHRVAFGGPLTWERFCGFRPQPDEDGPGWDAHPSRAGRLAVRLWGSVLAHEEIGGR